MTTIDRPLIVHAWGDSLTADGQWFPWMPAPWTMFDHGIGGDEWYDTIGARNRADILAGTRGDIAVLFGGTNDVRQGVWDVNITMAEVTQSVTASLKAGFAVVVVMPPPIYGSNEGPEIFVTEMSEYRGALLTEFLPRTDVALADIYTAFQADANPQSLYETDVGVNDGLHPWGQDPNFRGRILEADIITTAAVKAVEAMEGNIMSTSIATNTERVVSPPLYADSDEPLAQWLFNGTGNDGSVNALNLIPVGGPAFIIDPSPEFPRTLGVSPTTVQCWDNVDESYDGAAGALWDSLRLAGATAVTMQVWIRPDTVTGTHYIISQGGDAGTPDADNILYQLVQVGSDIRYLHNVAGGTTNTITTLSVLTIGDWTHIAITRAANGVDIVIYVNGVAVEVGTTAAVSAGGGNGIFTIGENNASGGTRTLPFSGLIAGVQVQGAEVVAGKISENFLRGTKLWLKTTQTSSTVVPEETVESIAGASLLHWYRGDAFVEGSGGAPDIASATNLEGVTEYNIAEAVSSKQPHSGVVNGLQAFTFAIGNDQQLRALGVTSFAAIGDFITIFVVAQPTAISATRVMFELGTTGVATGLVVYTTNSNITCQASTQTGGQQTISIGYTETTEYGVFQADLSSAGLRLLINDDTPTLTGPHGGLDKAQTGIAMGHSVGSGFGFDGSVAQVVVLKNATSVVRDQMQAFLIANKGAP